ncbi:uncharacterized protein N7483_001429 [Penicillium malachiteum]|uniref:uncharacterized protein n=1 Tax=Penicillium malachiteum TaxID=1324776 RepID=UPI00254738D1|nr:uncharacterized protein N7483_001429 [Penicillium malachiteum]KAJ5736304.1 hypothetical protein N7483_001429 [Penicillium malachiteum]
MGLTSKKIVDFKDATSFLKALGDIDPSVRLSESIESPEEFCQDVAAKSDNIFTRYETLNTILQRHEATIRKRWLKKTHKQRLKILLHAWPDMPTMHRPDFYEYRKGSSPDLDRRGATARRACFMWPYINQADLLNKNILPLFLNARGRHPSSYFAAADNRAMRLDFITGEFTSFTLCQNIMILNGMTDNTREYGKLMAWGDNPTVFNWMKERKQFMPGEGMLVLEAQERALAFLVECCEQILHDIPKSGLTGSTFPVLPEPPLKPGSKITGFESLSVMTADAPYRIPLDLNLDLIESLLAARASAAEDHLRALREDPGYFAASLLDTEDRRPEIMKDTVGNDHPVYSSGGREILWGRIIRFMISNAYLEFQSFSELSHQAKSLAFLQKTYIDDISPSKELPLDYLAALLRFKFFVNQMAKGPLDILMMSALPSPPIKAVCSRDAPDSEASEINIVMKHGVELKANDHFLLWLLRQLWEDSNFLFEVSLPIVVDELNRLIQSDPQARDLMSPYITKEVRDLSIISQCLNQLELYQPWARRFEGQLAEREETLKKAYTECTTPWAQVMAAIKEEAMKPEVVKLGEPSKGKFTYPIKKCRTRENVEVLRRSEANLDAFWALLDQLVIKRAGKVCPTALTHFIFKPHMLQRTPEWVETEKLPFRNSGQKEASDDADLYFPHQPVSLTNNNLSGKALDIPLPKTKVKTRGISSTLKEPVSADEADEADEAVLQPNSQDLQPSFIVDTWAFKVFSTIFNKKRNRHLWNSTGMTSFTP